MSIAAVGSDRTADARYRLGVLLLFIAAFGWSVSGFFTRLIPLDSWTLLFWRGVFGGLTALVYMLVQDGRGTLRAFRRFDRWGLLFTFLSTGAMTAFLAALRLTSVAHVAIIYATIPFVAAALAWALLRERVSPSTLVASGVALLGIVVAASAGGEGRLLGDALAAVMTLCFAGMVLVTRVATVPLVPGVCLSSFLASLVSLPFATLAVSGTDLANLALFGFCNMGLGFILFVLGSKSVPAAQTALITGLEGPLSPLWVWLAFGERPLPLTLVGGGIVIAAIVGNTLQEMRGAR